MAFLDYNDTSPADKNMGLNCANASLHGLLHVVECCITKQQQQNSTSVCLNEQMHGTIAHQPFSKLMAQHVVKPVQTLERNMDYFLSDMWHQMGDQRTSRLPFMTGGPFKLILFTLIYLYLIKRLLPSLMAKRAPLQLGWPIRLYNLFMIVSNIFAFYHGARILKFGAKCFGCEVIDHNDYSPKALELLFYGWLFFISRIFEWLDTIFFVLRKKDRQVTKLHVFHHSFVPLFSWVYLKFHPGYSVAFFPFVNTLVHTIMYSYYFLATFGPSIQPYLWWKKYLTSLQITQFVLILIQLATIPLSASEKCKYPSSFLYVAVGGATLFLWLFYTYYVDTYRKGSGKGSKGDKNQREGASKALSDSIDNAIISDSISQLRRRTSSKQVAEN